MKGVRDCKRCGAAIVWAETRDGKSLPVDVKPVTSGRGNIVLESLESGRVLAHVVRPGRGHYIAHFATCPEWPTRRVRGDDASGQLALFPGGAK